jgi:hypothetical protein
MLALVKWTSFIPHIWRYLYLFLLVCRATIYWFDHIIWTQINIELALINY